MPFIGNKPTAIPLSADDLEDNIITSAKIVDGTIATADIADANVTAAKLASGTVQNQSAFKNIIINGGMDISQRGTSASSLTGSGYNTVDRFRTNMGTAGTWTQSQSTDVPTGQGFATSFKMDCTTANASLSAGSYLIIDQRVEGQNLQYLKKGTSSAESTTISFWVKSAKTGTYIAALQDMDNTRYIANSYTISSANTWEKKTLTFAGDTSGAFGNDNAASLKVQFWLVAGTTYSSGTLATSWESNTNANNAVGQVNLADSTSNEWYITGVQLEAGTSASDFEFLPHDVNLQRCQRYYELCDGNRVVGTNYNSSVLYCNQIRFSVTKRASPTITIQNNVTTFTVFHSGGYDASQTWNTDEQDIDFFSIYMSNTRATGFIGPGDDLFIANSEL